MRHAVFDSIGATLAYIHEHESHFGFRPVAIDGTAALYASMQEYLDKWGTVDDELYTFDTLMGVRVLPVPQAEEDDEEGG